MKNEVIGDNIIKNKIYQIRGEKVMIDKDLADLYQVETKHLKRQVRRNIDRFPEDFMFELTQEEYESLRSQFGTLKQGVHSKYLPMAFTEQGIAMLSSVLGSPTAIRVNIQIIRLFTKMREFLFSNKELLLEMEKIKQKVSSQDKKIEVIFEYLTQFIKDKEKPRKVIGYKQKR